MSSTNTRRQIVTFDGGGIKGIITSVLLQRLVKTYPALLRKTTLMAGTSTGAIIAACISIGMKPNEIVELYRDNADDIFEKKFYRVGLFYRKYSHDFLKKLLKKIFGDTKLGDIDNKILIPVFDLDNHDVEPMRTWKPKFFNNYEGSGDCDMEFWKVLLYTTSAPVYFPTSDGYIDGGVIANNPSIAALSNVLKESGRLGALSKMKNFRLLSFGTGKTRQYISGDHTWGAGQWAMPLLSILFEGANDVADYQCRTLLGDRYYRVNPEIPKSDDFNMDSADKVEEMIDLANGVDLYEAEKWIEDFWL